MIKSEAEIGMNFVDLNYVVTVKEAYCNRLILFFGVTILRARAISICKKCEVDEIWHWIFFRLDCDIFYIMCAHVISVSNLLWYMVQCSLVPRPLQCHTQRLVTMHDL